MAKISHGANTWRSEGLEKKYKAQASFDTQNPRHKGKKKNTTKWCKGKVGTEHELYRYFYKVYRGNRYINSTLIRSRCSVCHKVFYSKDSSIPLRIDIHDESPKKYPIQVKVNGVAIPIDYRLFQGGHYCYACEMWEGDY